MPLQTSEAIKFNITLPGRVCQIDGESSTGKTFFLRALRKQVASIEPGKHHRVNTWLRKNIKFINAESETSIIEELE